MEAKSRARKLFWRRGALVGAAAVFVIAFFLVCIVAFIMDWRYSIGEKPAEDAVTVYHDASGVDDFVSDYRNQRSLTILSPLTNRQMMLADVPKIAEQFGIKDVYLADMARIEEIRAQEIEVYSLPEKMLADNRAGDGLSKILIFATQAGALPKDGAREAVLSENAAKLYNIDPEKWSGATVTIDDVTYTVVGVSREKDLHWMGDGSEKRACVFLSYENGSDRGAYRYSADTYDDFCERQKEYYKKSSTPTREVDTVLFEGTGVAEEMTDYLAQYFPASQMTSEAFYTIVQRASTREEILYMLLMLLFPAGLSEAIMDAILTSSERMKFRTLHDCESDERVEIMRCFRRQYPWFWLICAGLGAAMLAFTAMRGLKLHSIIVLGVYVVAVTAYGAIIFLTGGWGRKRKKAD
ncbi:MAG: hypothetical protein J5645_00750 [Lachnospiraceae bacterium]|nr:hypothetical protein [Lachnospiraceae bacterium]